jgi:hypothetical protein
MSFEAQGAKKHLEQKQKILLFAGFLDSLVFIFVEEKILLRWIVRPDFFNTFVNISFVFKVGQGASSK